VTCYGLMMRASDHSGGRFSRLALVPTQPPIQWAIPSGQVAGMCLEPPTPT